MELSGQHYAMFDLMGREQFPFTLA
jgi:hypothetical protein